MYRFFTEINFLHSLSNHCFVSHILVCSWQNNMRKNANTWAYENSISGILKRQYMKLQKVQMMSLSLPGPCLSEVSFLPHSHLAKQRLLFSTYFHWFSLLLWFLLWLDSVSPICFCLFLVITFIIFLKIFKQVSHFNSVCVALHVIFCTYYEPKCLWDIRDTV